MTLNNHPISKLCPIKPIIDEDARLEGIEHSIRTLGLLVPLIITMDRKIIDGNRRWYVLMKMYGYEWSVKTITLDVSEEKVWPVHMALNAWPMTPVDPARNMITAASETVKWQILSQLDYKVTVNAKKCR